MHNNNNNKDDCYNPNFRSLNFEEKYKIGISIFVPFVQIFDTFHHMNSIINVSNTDADQFWSLEKHVNPINTLFILCKIESEEHQDILLDLIYTMASERIGDKDFNDRADKILHAMNEKIATLST